MPHKTISEKPIEYLKNFISLKKEINRIISQEDDPKKILFNTLTAISNSENYAIYWLSNEDKFSLDKIIVPDKPEGDYDILTFIEDYVYDAVLQLKNNRLANQKTCVIKDFLANEANNELLRKYNSPNISVLITTSQFRKKSFGYIIIFARKLNSFNEDEINLIETIADDISYALFNAETKLDNKRKERKLIDRERYLKNLLNSLYEDIIVIDKDYNIVDANSTKLKITGQSITEIIGKKYYEILNNSDNSFSKNGEMYELKNVFETGIPKVVRHKHKKEDGSKLVVEVLLSPMKDENGEVIKVIQSIHDITKLYSTEKELKIFSEIVRQSTVSVLLTDAKNTIKYVNDKYLELNGKELKDVIDTQEFDIQPVNGQTPDEIFQYVKNGNIWSGEVKKETDNNSMRWSLLSITPIKNSKGKINKLLFIEQDITKQKKLGNELKLALNNANELNYFKTNLLGNLNHEIRTPMNSIIGFSQILAEESGDHNVVEMSNKIINSSQRLLNTLNSIIELSDLQSEKIKIKKTDVNLSHLIRSIKYSFMRVANEKNLDLEIDLLDENLVVFSDERLLEQILKSLLDNAIKYTEKGYIKIIAERKDDKESSYCIIKIKDTGIGIPEKNRDKIFDAFKQLSEGITRRFEGSGLGLTLAQKMANLINAKLDIDSTVGEGSTFSVIMPIEKVKHSANHNNESHFHSTDNFLNKAKKTPHLLVVEDDLMNIDVIKYFLDDFTMIENATNGDQVIKCISNTKYDLICMDINLKGSKSGIELLKEIKQKSGYENVPIIAISGYTSSSDQEMFLKEGFDGFLPKPFNRKQLREVIFKHFN